MDQAKRMVGENGVSSGLIDERILALDQIIYDNQKVF